MNAELKEIKAELQRRRHLPIPEKGAWLRAVVRGYSNVTSPASGNTQFIVSRYALCMATTTP